MCHMYLWLYFDNFNSVNLSDISRLQLNVSKKIIYFSVWILPKPVDSDCTLNGLLGKYSLTTSLGDVLSLRI